MEWLHKIKCWYREGKFAATNIHGNLQAFLLVSQSSWMSTSFADDLESHPGKSELSCRPAPNIDLN